MKAEADDDLWAAIADPSRRRVLDLLVQRGEASASRLAGEVPFSRQAVSKHLVVLEQAGLGALVDGVVSSAMVGAAKPDPALFEAALRVAGCAPDRTLHVGDSRSKDVAGAAGAGVAAVLLDRAREHPRERPRIESLAELPGLI